MNLKLLEPMLMVCRLETDAKIPDWPKGELVSITRTIEELSIVCEQMDLDNVLTEKDWRALKVLGPLDFSEIGILAELAKILAIERISIFVISSFDTDYLMLKEEKLKDAIKALKRAGHIVDDNSVEVN